MLAAELTDAFEHDLASSTRDGRCSTPPIGPAKVALTNEEVARERPFLHIVSPDVMLPTAAVVLGFEKPLGLIGERCCTVSHVSYLEVVD